MRTFVKEITWMQDIGCGWGNGYVVIPKGHKLHGMDYNHIDVNIHGGLTLSGSAEELQEWDEITDEDKDGWVVGFDTAHAGDTASNCSKEYVLEETENLKNQLKAL